jgi:YkoY family integral membrane protein
MGGIEIGAVALLLAVALLDSLLSLDNALVLAVVVEHLPRPQRARALRYGILGAYVLRGASLFFVSILANFWPLKLAGALYLLWLGLTHFVHKANGEGGDELQRPGLGFWMTVVQVEWLDLTFSLDNILATVALASRPDQFWIVVAGVFISILAMRYIAGLFLRFIERAPVLKPTAYIMVMFVGVKLLLSVIGYELNELETVIGLAGIIAGALLYERVQKLLAAQRISREARGSMPDKP